MLGIPSTTPYDLRFRLLGVPVRVHPFFWILMAALGWSTDIRRVLMFVGCGFVSILAHEYGHGLTARAFGYPASITLYAMGGLCASDGERQSQWERLFVVAAGPFVGYLLAALAFGAQLAIVQWGTSVNRDVLMMLGMLLYINVIWSTFNLLPIWPLDGGQLTVTVLEMISPRNGRRWGHTVSLLTAGVTAFLAWRYTGQTWTALWLGMFAVANYQMLEALRHAPWSHDGL